MEVRQARGNNFIFNEERVWHLFVSVVGIGAPGKNEFPYFHSSSSNQSK